MAVTWGTLPHYGQGQESAQHVQAVASASDSHSSSVLASASAYAPPGRRLVLVSGSACTVLLHNVVDGCCLHALTDPSGPVISLGLVNDLLAILVQNDGLSVYRCDVAGRAGGGADSGSSFQVVLEERGGLHSSYAASLSVAPDLLAVGSAAGDITLWDFRRGRGRVDQ